MQFNIIDIAVYSIIIISVAAGFYQGFIATSGNTVGYFIALLSADIFYGGTALRVKTTGTVIKALVYYSETTNMLGSVDVSRTSVTGMTSDTLHGLINNLTFPFPVEKWFTHNVLGAVYARDGLTNLGDYLSQTVAEVSVNIACFILIFLGVYIAVTIIVNLTHYVVKLPQVKLFDGVLGGAIGLVRGILLVFVVFLIMPAVLSMLPVQQVKDIVDTSQTAAFFYQKNFLFDMIRSSIG